MKEYRVERFEKNERTLRILRKLLKVLLLLIMVPILLIIIIFLIKIIFNSKEVPDVFGYKLFVVASESMEPKLSTGDLIIVDKNKKAQIGDIITYNEKQTYITHQVIQILSEDNTIKYITKGESNTSPDDKLVEIDQVEGVYIFGLSNGAKVFMYLQNPFVLISIMMLIFAAYINFKILDNRKLQREQKRISHENEKRS